MRILLWGINYAPEVTGIAVYNQMLAEWLAARGHETEVVTSFAYYPSWRKRPEDARKLLASESLNGVRIHRCWHYVPRRIRSSKRILHEASFVCLTFLRALALRRPDVVFVPSPPLPLGVAASVYSFLRRVPWVFHVQDLQPDAAVALKMLPDGTFARLLYAIEAFAYRRATLVSGISEGMLRAFNDKGVPAAKQLYFPNPAPLLDPAELPKPGRFRAAQGIPADTRIALYSGNLGVKHGLDILINAAELLRHDERYLFVICGDGAKKADLVTAAERLGLPNIRFLPLQPQEIFSQMLVDADVCLVTQQPGSGAAFFPSKLLNILGHLRPVVTVADDDSALKIAVDEGKFGLNVIPGDAKALAEAIQRVCSDATDWAEMCANGRCFVAQFDRETVLQRIEAELQAIVVD